jgi:NADH-quinone oxidoreductase subunit K
MSKLSLHFNEKVFQDIIVNFSVQHGHYVEASSSSPALPFWLLFTSFLFLAGLFGILFNNKNFLVTMMAIELMYLGAVSSFVLYGVACHDPRGAIYGLLFLILAACESAVGLGILIVLYRFDRTVDFDTYQQLGG